MKINSVQAVHVRAPLTTPYVYSRGVMEAFETVIVRMETETGLVGYGECAPLYRSPTGDAAYVARLLRETVAHAVVGRQAMDRNRIEAMVMESTGGNLDALCGVDLALWDLLGKKLGLPVCKLMGGAVQEAATVDYTVSAASPEEMADRAESVCTAGFPGVVVKVTGKDLEEDARRVAAVRRRLAPSVSVRVDCNAVYGRDEALAFLAAIAGLDVELVEQPTAANDLEGMAACRGRGFPLSADESLKTLSDALNLIRADACDILNVKVANVGGLSMAMRMAALAEAAGKPVLVGGRTSLEICRAASRHFAVSTKGAVGIKHEGPGPASQDLADDVARNRVTREQAAAAGGKVGPEEAPGLGVDVSWDKVLTMAVEGQEI